ncbi:MAG: glycosyltransferase family 2 protein [Candidatus Aenigmarchaeota archaeon]|nr:glycosyltransferase family 2 protein [Candidatus Aenigmarchaeota archaeon]
MQLTDIIFIIILLCLSYFTFFHLILWFESGGKLRKKQLNDRHLPNVSVIVPAYNEEKIIGQSLEKLLSIDYPKNKFEVIVVDDGSTDKTYEIAKKYESGNVRVIRKRNTGKASSLNFGIKRAKYEFVAVMDADSFLDKNALRQCMGYFDGKDVAAVTAHILVKRRKTLWERLQHAEFMIISVMRKAQEQVNVITATPGPLSVYRKDILVKLGGFDAKNLIEDVEITWRLLKHGYKVRMAFDAMVYSLYPDTLKFWWKQRKRWVIGGVQTILKYFGTIFDGKSHGVGNWIVPTSIFGYFISLLGTSIFGYIIFTKLFNYALFLLKAFSFGVNPFAHFELIYNVDLLFIYGFIMFLLALFVIRLSAVVHKDIPNIFILALFITLYPTLLTLNLLVSLYKFGRMERGWLTK